jgi:hypothetical protein
MRTEVLVSLQARFTFPGSARKKLTAIEERVPLKGILDAPTLADAVEHVLHHTDIVLEAEDVTSFKVDGHEIISTFIDAEVTDDKKKRKRDAEGMTRLLRKSLDVLAEAQAQREHGQVIGDDVMGMLENTVARFRATLDDWAHRRN